MIEKIKEVVNLTKQEIKILDNSNQVITLSADLEARVLIKRNENSFYKISDTGMSDIKINRTVVSDVSGIPPQKTGTIYIVPQVVFYLVFPLRKDVFIVDEPQKDKYGKILYYRAITQMSYKDNREKIKDAIDFIKKINSLDVDGVKMQAEAVELLKQLI